MINFSLMGAGRIGKMHAKFIAAHPNAKLKYIYDPNSQFAEEDIKKELSVISQEIAGVKDCPDDLVFEKFYELAYKDHPLGRSILGTYDNIAKFDKISFQNYISVVIFRINIFKFIII